MSNLNLQKLREWVWPYHGPLIIINEVIFEIGNYADSDFYWFEVHEIDSDQI